jgi:hypothetical protein
MENFIGIDISINSTAIYIESEKGISIISVTNKKDNNIWIKELIEYGVKFFHMNRESSSNYSKNEISKLKYYNDISDKIISEIIKSINLNKRTYCQIEGYSFSKNTSSILDIVGLSTIIRSDLIRKINNIEISIISPSSLKLETCKLVYKPIDIGIKKSKLKYVNDQGISGGSFKKPQMFKAIIDGKIDTPIFEMLNTHRDLMERDKIPNPIEDIVDATFACKLKIKEINDIR